MANGIVSDSYDHGTRIYGVRAPRHSIILERQSNTGRVVGTIVVAKRLFPAGSLL